MMNRVEMDDRMMNQVNGGEVDVSAPAPVYRRIHNTCGGEIDYATFGTCECKKCHESHFWMWDFDYTKEIIGWVY